MGISKKKRAELTDLVSQFNAKIKRVAEKSPELKPLQPYHLTEKYVEKLFNMKYKERSFHEKFLRAYLEEGMELPSEKASSVSRWSEAVAKTSGKRVRRGNVTSPENLSMATLAYVKENRPIDFGAMSAQRAKSVVYDLLNTTAGLTSSLETYKLNYLKAVEKELGKGQLYHYVSNLSPRVLVSAWANDPEIMSIDYVYSLEEAIAKEDSIMNYLEQFTGKDRDEDILFTL